MMGSFMGLFLYQSEIISVDFWYITELNCCIVSQELKLTDPGNM